MVADCGYVNMAFQVSCRRSPLDYGDADAFALQASLPRWLVVSPEWHNDYPSLLRVRTALVVTCMFPFDLSIGTCLTKDSGVEHLELSLARLATKRK